VLGGRFRFEERRTDLSTEVRGGITTFFVMAYIIFVNPAILTLNADAGAEQAGIVPPFAALVTATCLVSALATIAMGLYTNYPFALAPGMGLNAVVAFDLIATKRLPWPAAMGIVVLEGAMITILVVTGFRERVMHAVPLGLKRAIGVGIGMFILFIGLVNAGFVKKGAGTPVALGDVTHLSTAISAIGLLVTLWLLSRKVKPALLVGIAATTALAVIVKALDPAAAVSSAPAAADLSQFRFQPIDLSTIGRGLDFSAVSSIGALATALIVFSLMLSDFFDTMGTIVGLGGEAGFLDEAGRLEGAGRVLLVDSLAAVAGGIFGTSSVTTYIESAAGISSGARTGVASIVTGLLFLAAVLAAPLAGLVPPEATAPALVIVGFLMIGGVRTIAFDDLLDGFPALLTIALMPFTYSITNGIGAGFIAWVFLRVVGGRARDVAPLMWVMASAFLVYFASPLLI
jgi:adenine/guanine/hypoxanthine permease